MEQEVQNNQQDTVNSGSYTDPLADSTVAASDDGTGSAIGSTVAAVLVWQLFGLAGALICFGGFWAVRAVIKSRMSTALKVILSVLIVLGGLLLMFLYILAVAAISA